MDFLSIEVCDRKFRAKLSGSRDSFSSYVNYMLCFDSSISSRLFYASIGSDILRIARTIADLINRATRVNLLLIRMEKLCSECIRLISLFKKNTLKLFHKFADTADEYI